MSNPAAGTYNTNSKRLIILFSAKNSNTAKVANSLAKILGANAKSPQQVDPDELEKYDLVGFGSGIFDGKHHSSMIEFADELPLSPDKKVFIFSTSGMESLPKQDDPYTSLRACLIDKGVEVIDEFNCVGFNDNRFLKLFGEMNRGRPNNDDLKQAEAFAAALICAT